MERRVRESRLAAALRRRGPTREPYDRILIVCEGEKTERGYFEDFRGHFRLSSANVEIAKNDLGSSPISVVECAVELYRRDRGYDRVYCVFDRDRHPRYDEALARIDNERRRKRGSIPIHAVPSIPCFEFWILLHFEYTTRQFEVVEGSICDELIRYLRTYLPDYRKAGSVFDRLVGNLDTATTNAKRVMVFHETSGTDNPSTRIHELVEHLRSLNSERA